MKINVIAAGALSVTLLAGCAGGKKPTVVTGAEGSRLEVLTTLAQPDMNGNHYADDHLRVVGPASTGVVAGLTAVGVLLGGASISSDMFDKKGYRGTKVDALSEPTSRYFAPRAEAKIAEYLNKQGGSYVYQDTLIIGASHWSLVYSDLSTANSNYDLSYRVIFYKRPEGGNVFSAFTMADCAPAAKTAPLADWKANNYQKVTQETEKMMDACLLELDNQLPRLLKKAS
ncbi:hypothetical protein BBB56_20385 [Candidatus Pantoea deserta]|uniref:Lipoprotein n=1 Tax=Candidatus Pantoea deserta TaxID=1869313 RepID=A0A3N4NGU0_9GAMM|nr:hypothetical protein [Pantoea deserta]RPD94665.1 hypothetical protein BBB56_20385 [Pantoea deserta]